MLLLLVVLCDWLPVICKIQRRSYLLIIFVCSGFDRSDGEHVLLLQVPG